MKPTTNSAMSEQNRVVSLGLLSSSACAGLTHVITNFFACSCEATSMIDLCSSRTRGIGRISV